MKTVIDNTTLRLAHSVRHDVMVTDERCIQRAAGRELLLLLVGWVTFGADSLIVGGAGDHITMLA